MITKSSSLCKLFEHGSNNDSILNCLDFLCLSNGNFLSQKEQTKLVGAKTAGGVGAGVDVDASLSVDPPSVLG